MKIGRFLFESNSIKTTIIMEKLLDILTDDKKSLEGLPLWVYVIGFPAALIVLCALAELFK